jgi:hypothetical protein
MAVKIYLKVFFLLEKFQVKTVLRSELLNTDFLKK